MTSQKRLTKEESDLRNRADTREFKQRCINTFVGLKISYARLMALLNRNPDTDRYPIALDPIRRQWSELETLLYPIPDLPEITVIQAQHLQLPITQLPITGDIPEIMDMNIRQPREQTTNQHDKITTIRQELILRGQKEMRSYYLQQLAIHHPGKEFLDDPQCMPHKVKMTLLSKMALEPLEKGKFFPGTGIDGVIGVLVEADSTLGDRIICE